MIQQMGGCVSLAVAARGLSDFHAAGGTLAAMPALPSMVRTQTCNNWETPGTRRLIACRKNVTGTDENQSRRTNCHTCRLGLLNPN